MTSLLDVRNAIAATIRAKTIPSLTVATSRTTQLPVPYVVVGSPEIDYMGTFGRTGAYGALEFPVRVYVGTQLTAEAEDSRCRFKEPSGPWSIFDAIHSDLTLGLGTTPIAACISARDIGPGEADGIVHVGVEFLVRVVLNKES